MNLSTRGRYATRAMLQMALHYEDGPQSSAVISQSQEISASYLQQLLGTLKRAGLVRVVIGPGGGFTLARPPAEIPISAILEAVEGKLALVECVRDSSCCARAADCLSRELWVEANELLNGYFSSHTLASVLARCREGLIAERPPAPLAAPRCVRKRKQRQA
ncbi:MAG: Rrf2 family transcriptional regulator [Acidobacteriota bacterium]